MPDCDGARAAEVAAGLGTEPGLVVAWAVSQAEDDGAAVLARARDALAAG